MPRVARLCSVAPACLVAAACGARTGVEIDRVEPGSTTQRACASLAATSTEPELVFASEGLGGSYSSVSAGLLPAPCPVFFNTYEPDEWGAIRAHSLWRTFGTELATHPVGPPTASPLYRVGSEILYMNLTDGNWPSELRRLDGVTTTLLHDNVHSYGAMFRDALYFGASSDPPGRWLRPESVGVWRTDGRRTEPVHAPGDAATSTPQGFTTAGDGLLFVAGWAPSGGVWRSDGMSATALGLTPGTGAFPLAVVDGQALFWATPDSGEAGLWCVGEGTPSRALSASELPPYRTEPIVRVATLRGQVYALVHPDPVPGFDFSSSCPQGSKTTLWRVDCTGADSALVESFVPFPECLDAPALRATESALYFFDGDGTLFASNGTPEGTVPLLPALVSGSLFRTDLFATATAVFWTQFPDPDTRELWAIQGSPSSPERLATLGVLPMVTMIGDRLFFSGGDEAGAEPWQSDGTPAGTFRLADVNPGAEGSSPWSFVRVEDTLYFIATDAAHGAGIWKVRLRGQSVDSVQLAGLRPSDHPLRVEILPTP